MMPAPVFDYTLDGLRHRKWGYPAHRYEDGGVRGERWVYAVGETPYVVTFTVLTGRYPEGCDTLVPCGLDVSSHRAGEGDAPCIYLDGEPCLGDGSGLAAEEWYARAQGGDEEALVPDAVVFEHVRDIYTLWAKPEEK